jgi:hypothetical protein
MNKLHRFLCLAAALAAIALAVQSARPFTNEFDFATCALDQNCSNCLLGWAPDNTCASGWACGAFMGVYNGFTFQACVPSPTPTAQCNTGPVIPPITTCQGMGRFCACRSITTGDCAPGLRCDCNTSTGWFITTYTANTLCF